MVSILALMALATLLLVDLNALVATMLALLLVGSTVTLVVVSCALVGGVLRYRLKTGRSGGGRIQGVRLRGRPHRVGGRRS